ncbi:hypothetical protein TVAG_329070 [Trichomonas vaginalis G3]|uniref:F5/8 type C domain-containing protein n=1 Tax=Trichomonas vaginalis (strain ATCC PRA-98 / G3) TaxID=412133 RepID=A2EW48_TRIV3|nr:hypothetical protein TVAGG3_0686800 [Trichomonas vaginalis G3]EAY03134.1 hypothetical protein TVAG_329070 [Trichomonas vaginalis G3]KAI5508278.1 hypothetical protein TVAGG3_0686800 [Trichomonas vaginalis G3]|eukprot:XP_001315357.1 hypothetical protein [Trichomonas vaginalis G3]
MARFYKLGKVNINVSGSSTQYINGSRQLTKPSYAVDQVDKTYDWCSNCGNTPEEQPWIVFSIKDSPLSISGYYLRVGCCKYNGCCCEELGYCSRCCLYSWAFQISDDAKNWKEVHRVEKDIKAEYCAERQYDFKQAYKAKYFRLIQTEACPGEPPCLSLNKFEMFGDPNGEDASYIVYNEDEEDDVSIIGHLSKENRI